MSKLEVLPNECVMVGNDAVEDMIAKELGFDVFLLTDNIVNRDNQDVSSFKQGGYDELIEYIKNL